MNSRVRKRETKKVRGQSKKSESWAVHLLICWLFLLFYSNNMHKWCIKVRFLTRQMPVLSGRTNFDPFLKTWKFFIPKFPIKYSKNGQNFITPKNTKNVTFKTCWTPCKNPHFSMWPKSRNTFFWFLFVFLLSKVWISVEIFCILFYYFDKGNLG